MYASDFREAENSRYDARTGLRSHCPERWAENRRRNWYEDPRYARTHLQSRRVFDDNRSGETSSRLGRLRDRFAGEFRDVPSGGQRRSLSPVEFRYRDSRERELNNNTYADSRSGDESKSSSAEKKKTKRSFSNEQQAEPTKCHLNNDLDIVNISSDEEELDINDNGDVNNLMSAKHLSFNPSTASGRSQPEICTICRKTYQNLDMHLKEFHSPLPSQGAKIGSVKCKDCGYYFNKDEAVKHKLRCHTEYQSIFPCAYCRLEFTMYGNYLDHIKYDHKDAPVTNSHLTGSEEKYRNRSAVASREQTFRW